MSYLPAQDLKRGDTFATPFEADCVALSNPDANGSFVGLDSDGVECSFSLAMVTWVSRQVGLL